ncbi:TPA: hypothetical protein EYN23_24290 [Candidatus Poribacteria bacterium]|nr:hypothetical protein [Candidatus Poribacteria bacterium]
MSLVDSIPIAICRNRRIPCHRVLAKTAKRGKNSAGWFYG